MPPPAILFFIYPCNPCNPRLLFVLPGDSAMTADLIELVQNLGQPRVLVVGDVMLDRYVWGDAARISQEAPVLLLQADRREERLGGASSVATMLRALGARGMLGGGVGPRPPRKRNGPPLAGPGICPGGGLVDGPPAHPVKG